MNAAIISGIYMLTVPLGALSELGHVRAYVKNKAYMTGQTAPGGDFPATGRTLARKRWPRGDTHAESEDFLR